MSAAAAQTYEQYRADRGQEWMLRIGDPDGLPVVFIPPLFEEMNSTRALLVATMRALSAEGHCCWLPDLTGTSESLVPLAEVTWNDWRHGVTAIVRHVTQRSHRHPLIATIRGGCLLDDAAKGFGYWRFAPVAGASLGRDLDRASLGGGAEWAGYHEARPDFRAALTDAKPANVTPLRTVRLATDAGEADSKVEGPALWRRSEPGSSTTLAAALARDIGEWRQTCAAS